MSENAAAPRWRVLFTPRWLSWHAFAVVAFVGMWWLGDWQLHRALSGNALSWAYTFEWPIFAIFGVVFWVKTVRDELKGVTTNEAFAEDVAVPAGARRGMPVASDGDGSEGDRQDDEPDDAELAEYNAYLAKLNKEVRGHGKWHGLR